MAIRRNVSRLCAKSVLYHKIRNRISTAHDKKSAEFYSQFIAPEELCFDIGANVGNRTRIFRRLKARVVGVEPQFACANLLKRVYEHDRGVTIVTSALGSKMGEATMSVSDENVLSTLSTEWLDDVRRSGRFGGVRWDRTQKVQVSTLDHLITDFGVPKFAKIDVEGYELEVLLGLSRPVEWLSLEYTPECVGITEKCFRQLGRIGEFEAAFSLGESMVLDEEGWMRPDRMLAKLGKYKDDVSIFGDVYIHMSV